ncbi:MAG: IS66 family insertion sequence element accessory protein TnpA [Acidiferrobacterales bacterium]
MCCVWHALIQAFSHSSETCTQFCERHGVALSTFDRWRSLLRQESPAQAVSNTVPSPPGAQFVEIAEEDKPVTAATHGGIWDGSSHLPVARHFDDASGVICSVTTSSENMLPCRDCSVSTVP